MVKKVFITGSIGQKGTAHHKLPTYKSGHLLPVMSASDILSMRRYRALLDEIQSISGLKNEQFDYYYRQTIDRFTEFVQLIPHATHGALGESLNIGLAKAILALRAQHEQQKEDELLKFAVFTIGLFFDVNKVFIHHRVVMCESDGNYINDWLPFTGSMVGRGDYYKIYKKANTLQRLDNTITTLLARQLLPEQAFIWLSSDIKIFADWLDALRDDQSGVGGFKHILDLIQYEDILRLANSLESPAVDMTISEATLHGEAFLNWLQAAIENNDLKINSSDANIHIVEGGHVLIENKIFKEFVEISRSPVNMFVVMTQFGNLMGIAKKGGHDYLANQYFSENASFSAQKGKAFGSTFGVRQQSRREGVVVADASRIFAHATKIPVANKSLTSRQSAVVESHRAPMITASVSNKPSATN